MNDERIKDLYESAYALFDDLTPLPADCGKLCRRRCCKGDRGDGMLLFPGEEIFLRQTRLLRVKQLDWREGKANFAVCHGICRRNWRPLSCRIFPFAPLLDEDGKIQVVPDARAAYICPLLLPGAESFIRDEFKEAIRKAFTKLMMIPQMAEFLRCYALVQRDYGRFTQ